MSDPSSINGMYWGDVATGDGQRQIAFEQASRLDFTQ
ncbi:unnamed protein product [Kuraishia capsulata CBS 1993]|uniref:Uncharacterized protein n=1 Tax=Kuraishia capsulata CBS 1993 TaxID=1382522 RepID=W6MIY7_9ASCO|nr:uncharacterized protein KUCA_T00001884001 [Kuraishia capsulata CBS 1993]CDK25913.1 unnamed protein product [Kuraishia capsulata CBS 1993]